MTGLHVFDAERPRLPRRLKRRLRLVLHCVEKFGMDEHFAHPARNPLVGDRRALEGMLRYVQSIEPALVGKLRAQFQAGSKKSGPQDGGPPHGDDDYDPEDAYDPGWSPDPAA